MVSVLFVERQAVTALPPLGLGASWTAMIDALPPENAMLRTTVTLDEKLLERAAELAGPRIGRPCRTPPWCYQNGLVGAYDSLDRQFSPTTTSTSAKGRARPAGQELNKTVAAAKLLPGGRADLVSQGAPSRALEPDDRSATTGTTYPVRPPCNLIIPDPTSPDYMGTYTPPSTYRKVSERPATTASFPG